MNNFGDASLRLGRDQFSDDPTPYEFGPQRHVVDSSRILVAPHNDLKFDGAFIIDFWVNFDDITEMNSLFGSYRVADGKAHSVPGAFGCRLDPNGYFILELPGSMGTGTQNIEHFGRLPGIGEANLENNTWYHIAISRDVNNNIRFFLHGQKLNAYYNGGDLLYNNSVTIDQGAGGGLLIGDWSYRTEAGCNMDEFRVIKGEYIVDFSVPPSEEKTCYEQIVGCTDSEADNYNPNADLGDVLCEYHGCTNPNATNYDPSANVDDGSCEYPAGVPGCTDPTAYNYDELATVDDGSCIAQVPGCTSSLYIEYDPAANVDDGSCETLIVLGCTNPNFIDYNPAANVHDASYCVTPKVYGCTDSGANNHDPSANVDDGSCQYLGCTDVNADNYDSDADIDDGSCQYSGCTDSTAFNYDPNATVDDGSCIAKVEGCTDPNFIDYDPAANTDDGSCVTSKVWGCTDDSYMEYNSDANVDNGTCQTLITEGCTDPEAINYNPDANVGDASCIAKVYGCMDSDALNYDSGANVSDGSCIAKVYGCTTPDAFNYNPAANVDDTSCVGKVYGCTDPQATNYDAAANTNDGSCQALIEGEGEGEGGGESQPSSTSSYSISFRGTNYVPTITMLAHAKKGELNHSNNPTYLTYIENSGSIDTTGGSLYIESDSLEIANTTKTLYEDPNGGFQKQTWISKIGIYDENKNLIAIAKLANPIRKTEDRDFTFKLKLDF